MWWHSTRIMLWCREWGRNSKAEQRILDGLATEIKLQTGGDAQIKYQRPGTTEITQQLWILLALVNGFAPVPQKAGPKCCSELGGLGAPVLCHTQGMEGSCCSAPCEGCHLLEKEPEFTFPCELCSVKTLITAMQAAKGIGNTFFGGKKLFNFFSCGT